MPLCLHERLAEASTRKCLPSVIAYNRIDGPGSSLDLREFQQSLWVLPEIPNDFTSDPSAKWSKNLPRTIGITIDIGTKIEAHPYEPNKISVESIDYQTVVSGKIGEIAPSKNNWLLKILEIFNITGVKFILSNTSPHTTSSGLGGSATATTGVCLLANELAGRPMDSIQLVSLASRIEQDFGVSITGTQEQSNVIFGGITDYIWFPWGIPGKPETSYGESIRYELLNNSSYDEIKNRIAIFHLGFTRSSINVNSSWRKALFTRKGFALHRKKMALAYDFREGIRLKDWERIYHSINNYRLIRTELCQAYMEGAIDLSKNAENQECCVFPLGAGGGGAVLIFSTEPEKLLQFKTTIQDEFKEINFNICSRGNKLQNLSV